MKTPDKQFGLSKSILILSVLAAIGSAHADDEEIAQLTQPESAVSVGLGSVTGASKDRAIFGQYNGQRLDSGYLLLDIDVVKRNDTTGLWTSLEARNLGLDTPELRFSQNKQGNWKYVVEYNEMVRRDPRTINSGMGNAVTTSPVVSSLATTGTGQDLNFDIRRKGASLAAEKWLTANLLFEASVKSETRDGNRMSGIGLVCSSVIGNTLPCNGTTGAILMLPEMINTTTKQFEARLNYSGEKFLLSGGYYGSFFSNTYGAVNPTVSGNLYNPDGSVLNTGVVPGSTLLGYLQQPFALPPDNQAHQFHVAANYAFTPTTRATFKYAYTHGEQKTDFGAMGLSGAPAGAGNLGGVVDTDLAQLGLTARPATKLSLRGNLLMENKEDKTPLALYDGAYTNNPNSSKKLNGKVDASYQLPDHYRATLGVDYVTVKRSLPVGSAAVPLTSLAGLREETQEMAYRGELRRSMSDTVNAAVSYIQSKRGGGSWLNIGSGNATGSKPTGTLPMTMIDRKRDKVKVSADWEPRDNLSLQIMLESGKDKYSSHSDKGLRDTGMYAYGIDMVLALSDKWKLTGYFNQESQMLHVDHNVGYIAELENMNSTLGLGVIGNPSGKLEVGGELSFMDDSNRYKQSMASGTAIVAGGLPDASYRVASLKLYGKYALQKNADIRVNLIQQNVQFDEWSWTSNGVPFVYSDNTTITMQPSQNVTFLGASYVYKFR